MKQKKIITIATITILALSSMASGKLRNKKQGHPGIFTTEGKQLMRERKKAKKWYNFFGKKKFARQIMNGSPFFVKASTDIQKGAVIEPGGKRTVHLGNENSIIIETTTTQTLPRGKKVQKKFKETVDAEKHRSFKVTTPYKGKITEGRKRVLVIKPGS